MKGVNMENSMKASTLVEMIARPEVFGKLLGTAILPGLKSGEQKISAVGSLTKKQKVVFDGFVKTNNLKPEIFVIESTGRERIDLAPFGKRVVEIDTEIRKLVGEANKILGDRKPATDVRLHVYAHHDKVNGKE